MMSLKTLSPALASLALFLVASCSAGLTIGHQHSAIDTAAIVHASTAIAAQASTYTQVSSRPASIPTASSLPLLEGNGVVYQNMTAGRASPDDSPALHQSHNPAVVTIDCSNIPSYLSGDDCNYLSSIGVNGVGWGTSEIYTGGGGPNVFHLHNAASQPIIVVFWERLLSYVAAYQPALTISLAAGEEFDISFADNGVYGGFSSIYNHNNILNNAGQVWNTWGEFSSGNGRTFDVSREPDMEGSWLQIYGNNGCNAEWAYNFSNCAYTCSSYDNPDYHSCYTDGTYWLDNCYPSITPGAYSSPDLKTGGCQGWTSADVYFI